MLISTNLVVLVGVFFPLLTELAKLIASWFLFHI